MIIITGHFYNKLTSQSLSFEAQMGQSGGRFFERSKLAAEG